MKQDDADELLDALELRAMEHADEAAEAEPELKLLDVLSGAPPTDQEASAARDMTLGGYVAVHNRVPAFEGADGQPYTVDVDVEETGEPDRPFVAFLVFLRWAETGAGIMDHAESGDIGTGEDAEAARQAALDLSLYEVKAELDAAIERRRTEREE
ncbi:MAG TPA: hypothetical protein VFQ38_24915 [Longimicrobiales bacterium]|nr:hypothetical protein [Longimicrobiales bacterium]